ncbi:alanine racemase [Chenggangzhangella methanolivorans]|uniref:Alanine racemase n=1 Tax=Chenggangzhangella methanolivorans TaxID=1437009 RepID=A0A9E6UM48_9HYPH|nr:alanine racemase [Chenggangzhangella methanolivorans]QZN99685.1 alanine racemase [Chenggangzhangella methanolivorans]
MTTDFPGGRLTIDLGALADNWRTLRSISPQSECAAVVKADAYGIGLRRAAPALADAGAGTFFVAQLSEAVTARAAAPGSAVYVLNGLPPGAAAAYAAAGARPVLGSREEIGEWAAFVASTDADPSAAIHVDTGMNRLGLSPDEFRAMRAAGGPGFAPALLMSHLACADEPERPETARQRKLFAELRALAPETPASLANSAGTLRPETSEGDLAFDLRRPGVSLYGANPIAGFASPLKPVVRLEARIIQVRDVAAGETVGYGGVERMRRPSRVAVLSLGYADGILRAGGGADGVPGAAAFVGETPCPYVGRISMDLIAIDVTDTPHAQRGDWAEILGDHVGVDDLGRACGTIGYEILTSLGRRYERTYV